ncbi:Import inner membrane translocase subunit [Quillaja saponaria]|uniref:Import inner membrane translocase subunit n=1 Tax=Quillaja saponaria TaxID=32244 RepID=A0AAD7PRT7_QUISA|nr:Import inner membrane translocase subunit [Quillaja saponaria]
MSKPSKRVIQGLFRQYCSISHHLPPVRSPHLNSSSAIPRLPLQDPLSPTCSSSSFCSSAGLSNSTNLTSQIQSKLFHHSFASKPISSNGTCFRILSSPKQNAVFSTVRTSRKNQSASSRIFPSAKHIPPALSSRSVAFPKLPESYSGFRNFSLKSSDFSKVNGNFAKKIFDKPVTAVSSTFSRYSEAIGLQIEAFFKRNYLFLLGVAGVIVCALLWRIMFGIANTFVGLSEGMAKYGFLALSSAIVAFVGLYARSRFTINPDRVYRMAMRRLNTSAGILEVMGAPLSGTDLRAYVMSGGGLTVKKFKPSLRNKRCFLIFPIRGSERKGLVSVEVKKKKGQYDMKLLACRYSHGIGTRPAVIPDW